MDNSICQVYEEIQSLEEEIKLLAEKYEENQHESTFFSDEEIVMSIKSFQREFQGESKGRESPSDLKAELESLEADLSFLMKFTGIQFTSHSKKTVEKTRNRTVQKHRLSGNCHSLSFQLEFQLLEMQNKESVSAVITDLSIIMESGEDSDMSKFVSSTEERGNLLTFFRSLSSYAEWYEHRRCTFLHFKAKYPDIVTLPEGLLGDYIILRNPKLSGFELMIVWKIHIDEEGRTTPVLDLLTKVPEQVLQQKMATIETAPARFRSMLLLFGIETAIENLIKVVGLEK
ncbi:centromere protein P isoform X1 [Grus americana]|uniref:centromere protein P isoform X1 n=1 Tax=Grus americana TaxID=9117 RepID=UPI0024088C3E|nr:centromere protein P isoform X1 [Grus americana]XP_054693701.1 centromere protein P isoform X1 [Grus americana]XP_054693702.1 centromere protein P isoform X1 [Grus americana]